MPGYGIEAELYRTVNELYGIEVYSCGTEAYFYSIEVNLHDTVQEQYGVKMMYSGTETDLIRAVRR